ncbi:MAG: amidohydrolase family protein [Planctomycetes bacterium]|nr:amidohydrolase family protein [Planctomycetota bacterium]
MLRFAGISSLIAGLAFAFVPQAPQGPAPAPATPTPAAPIPWRPLPPVVDENPETIYAIHVRRAITISGDPVEDVTIVVRGGKISAIGKLVDIPRGAKRLDYSEYTAMPGLVSPMTRGGYTPPTVAPAGAPKGKDGVDPASEYYKMALKAGVTTLTIAPPGQGFTGVASAIRTRGKSPEEMIRNEDAYVFATFEGGSQSKDTFRQTFTKAKEEMERFEKAQKEFAAPPAPAPAPAPTPGPAPASQPASQPAAPPAPPPKTAPKLDPRLEPVIKVIKKEKKLIIQFSAIGGGPFFGAASPGRDNAAMVLHLHETVKSFDFDRVYSGGVGLALVPEQLSEVKASLFMKPELYFEPYTRNRLNAPDELRRAGLKVAFIPINESVEGYQNWLYKVGEMVRMGYPEKEALRAVTLTPAEFIGLGDQIGALAPGRDADILFFDGNPLDVTTTLKQIMIAGEIVPQEELQ